MLTEDEIKRVVELLPADTYLTFEMRSLILDMTKSKWFLDALAAELVRAVEQGKRFVVGVGPESTSIYKATGRKESVLKVEGLDRTENTIRAVLELAEKYSEVFE